MKHSFIKKGIFKKLLALLSSREPSSALSEAKFRLSPVSGYKSGSIATLEHTSVSKDAATVDTFADN